MNEGWLEIGLSRLPRWHVSSLDSPSLPLGGAPTSIRVIAAAADPVVLAPGQRAGESQLFAPRVIPLGIVLATPSPYDGNPSPAVSKRLQDRMHLPIALVEVDLSEKYDATTSIFVHIAFSGASSGDGASLADEVHALAAARGVQIDSTARFQKPLNTGQVNDPLHLWSRSLVSSNLIVADIDAMCLLPPGEPLGLVEIKRSGVTPWKPYRNDARNYALLRSMALGSDEAAFDLVIHYDNKRTVAPFEVNLHSIVGLSGWRGGAARTVGRLEKRIAAASPEEAVNQTSEWVQAWLRRGYWSSN